MKNFDFRSEPFKRLVVMGESHCAGASATRREFGWAEVLRSHINRFQDNEVEFVNSGIGADILTKKCPMYSINYEGVRPIGIERYKKHLIDKNPDLAVLAYGYNDIRAGTDLYDFISDYEIIVKEVKEQTGAVVVLVTPYYAPEKGYTHKNGGTHVGENWFFGTKEIHLKYVEAVKELAKKLGVLCADVYPTQEGADWLVCDSENCTDIHLHDLGHFLTANTIFATLAQNCSCLAIKAIRERGDVGKSPWRYDSNQHEYSLIREFYPDFVKEQK